MLTKETTTSKVHNKKVVVGYDLGHKFSQLSFYVEGSDEPQTVSAVMGTEVYNIPTVLAKRPGIGQWFYGREAVKYSTEGGILVDDLLSKALKGENVLVEDEAFDPVALLTLFVKRSLGMLSVHVPMKNICAFMFTVENLDRRIVEVLSRVVASLGLNCDTITYQSHIESLYSFMLHQPEELWQRKVLIMEFNNALKTYKFECSHNTTPEVVFIAEEQHNDITFPTSLYSDEDKSRILGLLDDKFVSLFKGFEDGDDIQTAFLIGDGFKENWACEFLKILCNKRRVFQGNNLFSKGACFALMDKQNPSDLVKKHVYLGENKVKSNVGMKALRRGEDSYFAIIDAGSNWYETVADFEIILDSGNEISFVITSLTGGVVIEKPIALDGLPVRPKGTTRLHIHIEMSAVNVIEVEIEDLGFGQIIKSSGRAWTQTLNI